MGARCPYDRNAPWGKVRTDRATCTSCLTGLTPEVPGPPRRGHTAQYPARGALGPVTACQEGSLNRCRSSPRTPTRHPASPSWSSSASSRSFHAALRLTNPPGSATRGGFFVSSAERCARRPVCLRAPQHEEAHRRSRVRDAGRCHGSRRGRPGHPHRGWVGDLMQISPRVARQTASPDLPDPLRATAPLGQRRRQRRLLRSRSETRAGPPA